MKFNYNKILLLAFGYFGISAAWATYNAFVPILLANKFQLSPAKIGFFLALDNIAALLIQPPIGAWSDRVRTPLGRRIPFILIGAPIGGVVLGIIPLATAFPLCILCAMTFLLSMALWRSPFFALLPDVTPSQHRSQANGIINSIGVTGAMLAFLGGGPLYRLNPLYPFWMGSFLLFITVAPLVLFFREPISPSTEKATQVGILKAVRDAWEDHDKSAFRILLAILLVFISNNALDAFIPLYSVNYLGLTPADGARLMGQLTVFFVLFAIPAGFIGSHIGRRSSICCGIAIMALCAFTQYLLPVSVLVHQIGKLPVLGIVPVVGIIMMLTGVGWALIHTNSLPMVVDMTTSALAGTYVGLYYLFSTLGAIINHQQMDHSTERHQLRYDNPRQPILPACCSSHDAGCPAR
jgi:MFS family permease